MVRSWGLKEAGPRKGGFIRAAPLRPFSGPDKLRASRPRIGRTGPLRGEGPRPLRRGGDLGPGGGQPVNPALHGSFSAPAAPSRRYERGHIVDPRTKLTLGGHGSVEGAAHVNPRVSCRVCAAEIRRHFPAGAGRNLWAVVRLKPPGIPSRMRGRKWLSHIGTLERGGVAGSRGTTHRPQGPSARLAGGFNGVGSVGKRPLRAGPHGPLARKSGRISKIGWPRAGR